MTIDLFQLAPAFYRLRDGQLAASMTLLTPAEQTQLAILQAKVKTTTLSADEQAELDALTAKAGRGPLQSLLMVIGEQLVAFQADLDQLYDDQFIETCAPWVIPYIGDLIGFQSIHGIPATVDNPRAQVAQTIALRRRKGTVLALEQLARDVTGWGAHAVEFFQVLSDTQYVKHIRPKNFYAPDVRSWRPRYYRNSGFSRMSRTVDVHNPRSPGLPRYAIPNIGVFLWSLGVWGRTKIPATASAANTPGAAAAYRLNPLDADMPLFHFAVPQGQTIAEPARPENVPDRLSRLVLCDDLQKGIGAQYYGEGKSLALYLDGKLLNPWQIQVADLSGADGSWANLPQAGGTFAIAIDPELGRAALPPVASGPEPALTASFAYGFNADMGGGEYERNARILVTDPTAILPFPDTESTPRYTTLQDAVTFAAGSGDWDIHGRLAIQIEASGITSLTGPLVIDVPAGKTLELRAQDQTCSVLMLDGEVSVTGDQDSSFVLSGLVLAASAAMSPPSPQALVHAPTQRPDASPNQLSSLVFNDCTLVPGWALTTPGEPVHPDALGLFVEASGLSISAERSILGAIRADELATVSLTDSILDATDPAGVAYYPTSDGLGGADLTLLGCTVVGRTHARTLTLVSDSIIWATAGTGWVSGLIADRRQAGCVRFSFLPPKAVTPRRFECVEQALASAQPIFFSLRNGHPGYLKMLACTDPRVRRGADDGGEMGAFHYLLAPLRESDLLVRLQEFTPVGLQVGLIYQT
jgi:hypothetical protein